MRRHEKIENNMQSTETSLKLLWRNFQRFLYFVFIVLYPFYTVFSLFYYPRLYFKYQLECSVADNICMQLSTVYLYENDELRKIKL